MPSRIRDYLKRFALPLRIELATAKFFASRKAARLVLILRSFPRAGETVCFANRKEKLCLAKKIALEKFKKQSDEEL
jgi:hypothetical protein